MLSLYFGPAMITNRQAALAAVAAAEKSDKTIVRFPETAWHEAGIREIATSHSLFADEFVYLIDTPSEDPVFADLLVREAAALAQSVHLVIIIDGPKLAPEKKQWEKAGAQLIESTAEKTTERFNAFAMAEALLVKDKRLLWLLLTKAKLAGLSDEELIGTLWWQLKTLRLAAVTTTAAEAGLKDFPYNKAKRALKNFAPRELEQLSQTLLVVYHDGHGGIKDIAVGLEEWVLQL